MWRFWSGNFEIGQGKVGEKSGNFTFYYIVCGNPDSSGPLPIAVYLNFNLKDVATFGEFGLHHLYDCTGVTVSRHLHAEKQAKW